MQHAPPFQAFIQDFTRLVDVAGGNEEHIRQQGAVLLAQLIAQDDWLPEDYAQPDPQYYQQYLLHCDPKERFSVVSFVWGPGQKTPVHDHTVWGLIGMLRGAERGERFALQDAGKPMKLLGEEVLEAGKVEAVSPAVGDIHRVANVHQDRASISIHVYGGNIGKITRHVYDPQTGATKDFVSGYSNAAQAA